MATFKEIINKDGSTTIKAYVRYKGVSVTKNFPVRGNNKVTTKREARIWADNLASEIDSGTYRREEKKHNFTIKEAIEMYIADGNPKKDESTRRMYISALNWFKNELGMLPIKQLTRSDLKRCRDKLCKKHKEIPIKGGKSRKTEEFISNSSVNRYLAYFSTFLSYCVYEYEILEHNPAIGAKLKLSENEPRKRWLNELKDRQELLKYMKNYSDEAYLATLFMLTTGARNSEIAGLTWKNTDLENKAIYFLETKNGEDRTIAIPDILYKEIFEYKKQCKVRNIKNDYLFPNTKGEINVNLFYEKCNEIINKSGFNTAKKIDKEQGKLTMYNLRHTYTSIGGLLGVNTDIMDKITGHKNGRMTSRYTHADCESLREPMNKIANYMVGVENSNEYFDKDISCNCGDNIV